MSGKSIHIPKKVSDLAIDIGILVVVCLIVAGMLTLFSPSAALNLEAEDRLEFWIYLCLIGGGGIFSSDFIFTYFDVSWPALFSTFLQSICGAIAVLVPLYVLYDPAELPGILRTSLTVWFVMVLIIAGVFSIQSARPSSAATPETAEPPENQRTPKILARLPVHLKEAELYALSAEDHYVRVHTSKGEDIILMRLSDAISEAGHLEGLQTHRSWWVAKHAIDDIKLKNRAADITLCNGLKVPVSRNALKLLKDKGWL